MFLERATFYVDVKIKKTATKNSKPLFYHFLHAVWSPVRWINRRRNHKKSTNLFPETEFVSGDVVSRSSDELAAVVKSESDKFKSLLAQLSNSLVSDLDLPEVKMTYDVTDQMKHLLVKKNEELWQWTEPSTAKFDKKSIVDICFLKKKVDCWSIWKYFHRFS